MARCCLLILLLLAGRASAGTPTFVSLDRTTGTNSVGAHLGVMSFEDSDSDGGQPELVQPRLQIFGELRLNAHFGVLLSTSAIWFRSEPRSELGLGATALGAYGRYTWPDLELVARLGLILPTSSFIPRDSYYEHVAIHGTLFPWLEERALDADVFWGQARLSGRYRAGSFTIQLDGLIDVPLASETYTDMMSRGSPVRLHIGVGGAYATGPWRFTAEVVGSGYPFAEQLYGDLEGDEGFYYGATASAARSLAERGEIVVWFSNPLDQYIRSRWHAVGVGYQRAL